LNGGSLSGIITPHDSAKVDATGWRVVACKWQLPGHAWDGLSLARSALQSGGWYSGMIRLFRGRFSRADAAARQFSLGALEIEVMQMLWKTGESSVRGVFERMERPLAYTTVMTTLERLFKKSLLDRRKEGRAFLYTPRLTLHEWEHRRAGDLVADLLSGPNPSRELLVSCLVDAVGREDDQLLEDLERKIRQKRRELSRRSKP
jgi:predicted transcriptional regulator